MAIYIKSYTNAPFSVPLGRMEAVQGLHEKGAIRAGNVDLLCIAVFP